MDVLRTPDSAFDGIKGFDHEARYVEVNGLRMHYVDVGPSDGHPVLLLHGEPTWAYLYRHMIDVLVAEGRRCVAIDLIGFGRSDKPAAPEAYSYQSHLEQLHGAVRELDLRNITMFCQDWGGLLGLRILAEDPDRFARVCAANTFLPTGDFDPGEGFRKWREYSQTTPDFHVGGIVKGGCVRDLTEEEIAAYNAPFPEDRYKVAARRFPLLVPITPDDPASEPNRAAWEALKRCEIPFLTLFGDKDPVTRGAERVLQKLIPGAEGQPHEIIQDAGHFIQEDAGEVLARKLNSWIG